MWSWGSNSNGQLGLGDSQDKYEPAQVQFPHQDPQEKPKITQVGSGSSHTLFLSSKGLVYACGDNQEGQLGIYTISQSNLPILNSWFDAHRNYPNFSDSIKKVVCGSFHTIFLTNQGHLYACGRNTHNELGTKDSQVR